MAGKEIEYRVDVDAKGAERGFKQVGKAAERAGKDVAESFEDASDKAAKAIVEMAEKMDAELRSSIAAADALATALGPELTAKTDVDQVVADLNRMGLTFDEIRGDADKFAAALKQVDGIRLQQVNDGLDTTRSKLGQVGAASDQSRSVLANLAGNAAQDLGALGGVVGSLGVGVGQLAEYAVDGNIALSNLAKVAGPMLGLSAALAAVGVVTSENAKRQQQYNELFEAFTAALEDTSNATEAVNTALTENKELFDGISKLGFEALLTSKLPLLNRFVDDLTLSTEENIEAMAQAGITVGEWSTALTASDAERTAFIQSMKDMVANGQLTQEQFQSLALVFGDQRAAVEEATTAQSNWADVTQSSLGDINDALVAHNTTVSDTEIKWRNLLQDLKDGRVDTLSGQHAWNALKDTLQLTNEEMAELAEQKLDEQLEADTAAAEALGEAIVGTVEAFRDAGEAIDDIRTIDLGAIADGLQDALDVGDVAVDFQAIKEDVRDGFDDLQKYIDEQGAPDWSAMLDTSADVEGFNSEVAGLIAGLRDTFQEGIVEAFEINGASAAQHFVDTFLPRLLELGLTRAEAYELLGLPPDGRVDAIIEPLVDQAAAARAIGILDAIAGTGVEDPRIAGIQIALATGNIDAEIAEVAALLLASELGIPVHLGDIPPEDIAAAQGYLDNNPVTFNTRSDGKAQKEIEKTAAHRYAAKIDTSAPTASQTKATIDGVAKPGGKDRTAMINTAVAGDDKAKGTLAGVAAARTAPINVSLPNYSEADFLLDLLANDRFADVFVRLHGVAAASRQISGIPGASPGSTRRGVAPAATRTPAPTVVTVPAPSVTIQAAVIGNRFDVERTVAKALRGYTRTGGRR